jgi:hypothetical protein
MGNLPFVIARLISSENATPKTRRWGASILFATPVALWLFPHLGRHILDKAGVAMIWLFCLAFGIIFILTTIICAKLVPTKILLLLAAATWLVLIWAIGFHDYF